MGPICNESFGKKKICGSREQCTGSTGNHWNALLNGKKKSETLDVDCIVAVGPTYENAKCQNTEIEMLSKRVLSVL